MHHARERDNGDMFAFAFEFATLQRHCILDTLVRDLALDVVEQLMFKEQDRIRVANSGFEHALGIVGSRRNRHFETRNMRIERFEHLRMLSTTLSTTTDGHTEDNRYGRLTAKHIMHLCRTINNLVAG